MGKKGKTYQEHYDYMQSVLPKLIEAEKIVDNIKQSEEWKRSANYFKVLYKRGMLTCNFCKKYGYKIEKKPGTIDFADLEKILDAEQLEKVLEAMKSL